jgi:glycine cleavage system aminomethyltransferase T
MPVRALRISYAGEHGWELYTATEHGRALWDTLAEAGRPLGARAAGLGAFDSLRVEKGYRFAGQDMHTEHTPAAAGLGFTVDFSKPDFIGRGALLHERAGGGPQTKLTPLVLDDQNAAPLGYEPLIADGRAVGYVTSANFGYTVGKNIVYGYLPVALAEPGSRVSVRVFDREVGGEVTTEPLYDPRGERMRG